tara:strand:- start:4647 stop:6089 length:1443 start_codon:yes stop_codon:yes gene_type:complete
MKASFFYINIYFPTSLTGSSFDKTISEVNVVGNGHAVKNKVRFVDDVEYRVVTLSGKVKENKPYKIATLTLTAAEYRHFSKKLKLKKKSIKNVNSRLKLKPKSTKIETPNFYTGSEDFALQDVDKKVITSMTYDLMYTAKEDIRRTTPLEYMAGYRTKSSKIYELDLMNHSIPKIKRVDYGKRTIGGMGEKRKISVYGDPGAEFAIIVTKLQNSRRAEGELMFSHEEAITSNSNYQYLTYKSIKTTIPTSGVYSYYQEFPHANTKCYYYINFRVVTGSSSYLQRKRQIWDYYPYLESTTGYDVVNYEYSRPEEDFKDWHSTLLTQNHNRAVKLILRASESNRKYTINGDTIPGSGEHIYDLVYKGKPNKAPQGALDREFKVTYNLTLADAAEAITINAGAGKGNPVFGGRGDGEGSYWTNSNMGTNGGASVAISGITTSVNVDGSNDKAKLEFNVIIKKFGSKDIIMEVDLDNIFTVSGP